MKDNTKVLDNIMSEDGCIFISNKDMSELVENGNPLLSLSNIIAKNNLDDDERKYVIPTLENICFEDENVSPDEIEHRTILLTKTKKLYGESKDIPTLIKSFFGDFATISVNKTNS